MAAQFDAKKYMQEFTSAWNERDLDRLVKDYAENAEYKDPTIEQPLRGRNAIREGLKQWMGAFTEQEFQLRNVLQTTDEVALLMHVKGRNTGDLELAPGQRLPATGKTIEFEAADFLKLDDQGKIVRDELVFDTGSLMQQLGASGEAIGQTSR